MPAEKIITKHYRLGSSRVILSRSFCDINKVKHLGNISLTFINGIKEIREYEEKIASYKDFFTNNIEEVKKGVEQVLRSKI